jgi:hypothetical protein
MIPDTRSAATWQTPTLSFTGMRAFLFQLLFIALAVLLPAAAHLTGISVRMLLPMHWPVLLAGLVYGWRAGLLTGILAPVVNYLITGYPLPPILPSMTVELLTYGFIAGILREVFRFNAFIAIAIAAVLGRLVFAGSVIILNVVPVNQVEYFRAALVPGIFAALLQIILLPIGAQWWIDQARKGREDQQ